MWFALWVFLICWLWVLVRAVRPHRVRTHARSRLMCSGLAPGAAKPPWVVREVLALDEALNDGLGFGERRRAGCRAIAAQFNALHEATGMRVGKSFVADVLARQRLHALHLQREVKHVVPAAMLRNRVWAMDAAVLPMEGLPHAIALGIVDHGSRVLTALRAVTCFNAWTALGVLCITIGQWGKPARLRTDNAAVFHSRVWRVGLQLLGIKRQFTQPGCPWQNGRIERLFGTLKERWAELAQPLRIDVHLRLGEFAHWYNAARPHQHLHGRRPIQAWHDDGPVAKWHVVQWWGGALRAVKRE